MMEEEKTILVSNGSAADGATYKSGTLEMPQEDAADDEMIVTAKEEQAEWNPNTEQLLQLMFRKSQR